jgi:hypothetical protein
MPIPFVVGVVVWVVLTLLLFSKHLRKNRSIKANAAKDGTSPETLSIGGLLSVSVLFLGIPIALLSTGAWLIF